MCCVMSSSLSLLGLLPLLVFTGLTAAAAVTEAIACGGDDEINVTNRCPPWSVCSSTSHHCKCATQQLRSVKCGVRKTWVLYCNCLTYSSDSKEYRLGKCFYNCGQGNPSDRTKAFFKVPGDPEKINEAMCGNLKRGGTLCGQCLNDSYPLVYSYNVNCVKCPRGYKNWWKFILAAFGPLTIFYLIVLLCKVKVTPGYMYAFVFYAQAMSTPVFLRSVFMELGHGHSGVLAGARVLSSIYGIWSLDFFRAFYTSICLGLDTLESQALEYTIALYPLLLIGVSYILLKFTTSQCACVVCALKPFNFVISAFQRNWDTTTSLVDAYAMFFILSLTKILYVSCDLLLPTRVHTLHSNGTLGYHWALYFDGSKDYFGKEHLPFAVLAITIVSIFILLPGLVLCLFPFAFFQHFLNGLHCDVTPLRLFVEKFQGFYKNGQDPGTRDCRWFSLFHILLLILMFTFYGLTLNIAYYSFGSVTMIAVGMIYAIVQPYKRAYSYYNKINIAFFLLLAIQYTLILGSEVSSMKERHFLWLFYGAACVCSVFPIVYLAMVVSYKVGKRLKCRDVVLKWRFQVRRMNYDDFSQEHSLLWDRSTSLQKIAD